MSVNTGRYVFDRTDGWVNEKVKNNCFNLSYIFFTNRDDTSEVGYRISKENDRIDAKYGFERVKDTQERTGYLFNMHSVGF